MSGALAGLLGVAAVVELFLFARDIGTTRLTYLELTSPAAAALSMSAAVLRSSQWRTRLAGAGLGAWAAIGFAPFFLFVEGPGTIVGWLILAGVAGMIAALSVERRLVAVNALRELAVGALVGFGAMVAIEIGLVVISVVFQSYSI